MCTTPKPEVTDRRLGVPFRLFDCVSQLWNTAPLSVATQLKAQPLAVRRLLAVNQHIKQGLLLRSLAL